MAGKKNRGGLVFENIEPGSWYQGVFPGGFTDATTSIHVPGPKVHLDTVNKRQVTSVAELPDPIQLPHLKEVYEFKDKDRKVREKVLAPFDRKDDYPYHEAFQMALSTGIIRKVEDHDVEKYYPKAWANRREKIVYTSEIASTPMADLIEEREQAMLKERAEAEKEAGKRSRSAATEAAGKAPKKPKPDENKPEEPDEEESGSHLPPPPQ